MADMSKAEKLAAARKKLREFQHNRENAASPDKKHDVQPTVPMVSPSDLDSSKVFDNSPVSDSLNTKSPGSAAQNEVAPSFKLVDSKECDDKSSLKVSDSFLISDTTNNNNVCINNESMLTVNDLNIQIQSSTPLATITTYSEQQGDETQSENVMHSTSETLLQLAMRMNGLLGTEVNETGSPTLVENSLNTSDKNELMSRNQQLAAQLADKEQSLAHMQVTLVQLQKQASEREAELQRSLVEAEQRWSAEAAALRDQLQLHTQTVGILVAEKTEAQAALSRAQLSAKAKAAEAEEAQGRLRASRQKLTELEATVASLRSNHEEGSGQLQNIKMEHEKVQDNLRTVQGKLEESREEVSQLQQRFQLSTQEIASLQSELNEKQSQLSIAQIRLQQLGGTVPNDKDASEAQAELEAEHERRTNLEIELSKLRSAIAEKDQSGHQYQQFIQQLNTQLTSLASKLQDSMKENETLEARNESLIKHISGLETRLQRTPEIACLTTSQDAKEIQVLKGEISSIKESNVLLEQHVKTEEEKSAALQAEVEKLQEKLLELQGDRPDDAKLLAVMESDKVAAARATAQNTQLKQQLVEMQHVQAQLVDQLRHFEAKSKQAEHLQRDLLEAQEQLKALKATGSHQKNVDNLAAVHNGSDSLTLEASSKLQERFTETMRRLAETSDEKQRLEHLVMQLQGETETIGEYVALYQQQRGMLQQRAAEKDREVARMAADRELMREKLHRVGQLVSVLVHPTEKKDEVLNEEEMSVDLAAQIKALLSEIGDSEALAEPSPVHKEHATHHPKDTMLPCPLCSGRLEVV